MLNLVFCPSCDYVSLKVKSVLTIFTQDYQSAQIDSILDAPFLSFDRRHSALKCSVTDPNRLCSDPDLDTLISIYPDPVPEPNRIIKSLDPDPT